MEKWKPIIGYEGLYEISSLGRVKSLNYLRTGKEGILKQGLLKYGHSRISLYLCGITYPFLVHRLVAIAFLPNPLNMPLVCHKDETLFHGRLYNGMDNLFWGTHSDNVKDMYNKGRDNSYFQLNNPMRGKFGKDNPISKKINQYTLDWIFIRTWGSIIDAAKDLLIDQGNISKCCNGKQKSAGGFIWRYKTIC